MAPANGLYPLLPDPSPLDYYLFESPWQLGTLFALAAIVLIHLGKQKKNKQFLIAGIVSFVLGILVVFLARSVTTTREVILAQTTRLIGLTTPLSTKNLRPMLTDDCVFYAAPDATTPTLTVGAIDFFMRDKPPDILQSNDMSRQEATVDSPTTARSQVWLKSQLKQNAIGQWPPVTTRWEFEWELKDGAWKVRSVRLVEKPE